MYIHPSDLSCLLVFALRVCCHDSQVEVLVILRKGYRRRRRRGKEERFFFFSFFLFSGDERVSGMSMMDFFSFLFFLATGDVGNRFGLEWTIVQYFLLLLSLGDIFCFLVFMLNFNRRC